MSVLGGTPLLLPASDNRCGGGLEEDEQEWSDELSRSAVDDYLSQVHQASRRYLAQVEAGDVVRVPDTSAALAAAGVPTDTFDWLYRMWDAKPGAMLVRWPLIGHVANHVGEMIAMCNRMGLSPF